MTDYSIIGDERKSKEQLVRELKSLREEVVDKDRLLAELIRNYKEAPIGLCVIDLNLRYVHINDWLAEINGVSVEEHLGRTVREVLPDIVAGIEPQFHYVIETGKSILGGTVNAETPGRPGITRTFQHNYYPIKSGDATVVGVSCVVQDITEHKELEAQLREAQKLEALGRMTGGVAHEFNNLLQAIVDSLDVMRDGVRDADRAKRMIELAQRSAFRGKDLTGRLLSYVGKHPIRPEVVDVGEFVRDAVDLFEPLLGETIKIEALIADDLWPIKVDCEQLEIAALNLAINAKDTMVGGGKLTFEASNVHIDEALAAKRPYTVTPGDYVKLAITDTGTGMSQEVRDQAFDPFFTTKDVGKGTGLGLSMVYGFVVRQSGGFVDIDSEEGRGTTVALFLRRAEATKAKAPQPAEGAKTSSIGTGTILLVEDHPEVLYAMALVLEGLGYTVLKAKDGAEALTVLEQAGVISLLLADVILPGGMSGIQLADTVRRANPAIKVIVMSGYPENQIDMTALSKAGVPLLKKPFRPQELASAIKEALGSASKQGA